MAGTVLVVGGRALALPGHQATAMRLLLGAARPLGRGDFTAGFWAYDQPLHAGRVVNVILHRLRARLAPHGWAVVNLAARGAEPAYALRPLE